MSSKTIKKVKDLISEAAKSEGIPEEHLNNIVMSAYRESRHGLSNMVNIRQKIVGLGYFVCKIMPAKWTIEDDEKTLVLHPTNKTAKERLPKLKEMIRQDAEERQRWKEKIGEKERYMNNKRNNENDTQRETTEGMGQ